MHKSAHPDLHFMQTTDLSYVDRYGRHRFQPVVRPCLGNRFLHARVRSLQHASEQPHFKCLEISSVGLIFTNLHGFDTGLVGTTFSAMM